MPHTVDDFWRMIWQYKVAVVIMGCKEVELGRNRCHRYWPEPNEEMWFHDIKVLIFSFFLDDLVLDFPICEENWRQYWQQTFSFKVPCSGE